jgi:predicted Zn-ribbon and HTH transcriptional regulator
MGFEGSERSGLRRRYAWCPEHEHEHEIGRTVLSPVSSVVPEKTPPERTETVREAIAAELRGAPVTARELSERVGIPEREVGDHLEHLARSARGRGEHLVVEPPRCLACGFAFEGRDRPEKPGKCPSCRATRIAPPRFSLA